MMLCAFSLFPLRFYNQCVNECIILQTSFTVRRTLILISSCKMCLWPTVHSLVCVHAAPVICISKHTWCKINYSFKLVTNQNGDLRHCLVSKTQMISWELDEIV